MWRFHRAEYSWHLQRMGSLNDVQQQIVAGEPNISRPFPRVSIHSTYYAGAPHKLTVSTEEAPRFVQPGLCLTLDAMRRGPVERATRCVTPRLQEAQKKLCDRFNGSDPAMSCWLPLFRFEFVYTSWTWDQRCAEAQREYLSRLAVDADGPCMGAHEDAVLALYKPILGLGSSSTDTLRSPSTLTPSKPAPLY
jgi:hypothetical protein